MALSPVLVRCHFRPTKTDLARLDVREVKSEWSGHKEKRAFNIAVWDELNAAAKKKAREEAKKNPKPKRRSSGGWDAAAYERQRRREEFGKALYLEKANTLARAIGERLDPEKHSALGQRALLFLALAGSDELQNSIAEVLGFKGGWRRVDDGKALGQLVGLRPAALEKLPFEIARRTLGSTSEHAWSPPGPSELHSWLCKELKIDFAEDWKASIEFLELFEGDDRRRLIEEIQGHPECATTLRMESPATVTNEVLIGLWPAGFVPRELLLVDAKGKIPASGKKTKAKAKGKQR